MLPEDVDEGEGAGDEDRHPVFAKDANEYVVVFHEERRRFPCSNIEANSLIIFARACSTSGDVTQRFDELAICPELHVIPCIVREIMRVPVGIAPAEVGNIMEAGLSYHNASQYAQALDKYDQAEEAWAKSCSLEDSGSRIPPEGQLFLRCARGSVHESAGNDELALQEYLEGRKAAVQLDVNHPDVAVSYSCIGSVCYHVSVVNERAGGDEQMRDANSWTR